MKKQKFICHGCSHPCKLTVKSLNGEASTPIMCPIFTSTRPKWERNDPCPTCGRKPKG